MIRIQFRSPARKHGERASGAWPRGSVTSDARQVRARRPAVLESGPFSNSLPDNNPDIMACHGYPPDDLVGTMVPAGQEIGVTGA